MNKNNKKGAAESKWLSERGPVDGGPEKAVAKKKGPAQEVKEKSPYQKILQYGKDVAQQKKDELKQKQSDFRNASMLDSINLEASGQGQKAKEMYGENYEQFGDKGNKYLGDKNWFTVMDDMSPEYRDQIEKDYKASEFYQGPGKMGYTQNFGPARQNGYAKGAAKVNEIMGKGASRQKYGGNKGDESRSKRDYEG